MQIFQDIDGKTFSHNNRRYVKNYIVMKVGDTHISIINAYDTRLRLLSSTHYSQIEIDGEVLGSQEAVMSVLSPIVFSKQIGVDINISNQNNVARYYPMGQIQGQGAITPNDVVEYFNGNNFTMFLSQTSTPVILEFLRTEEGKTTKYLFLFTGGKGVWGTNGDAVYSPYFKLISVQVLTPTDIEDDPNSNIQNLGEIPDGDFISVANQTEWDFTDTEISYYFSYTQDDILYFVLFVGEAGTYGGGVNNDDFSESDFISTTNSDVQPAFIPSLQQVLDEGNIASGTTLNIYDSVNEMKILPNAISFEKNTYNSQIRFQDPVDDLYFYVPAKVSNDTFAMLSDISSFPSATGTTAQYIKGNGDLSTFVTDVRNTTLSGLTEQNSSIIPNDTILTALGKAQGQISNVLAQAYVKSFENTVTVNRIAFVDELPITQDPETAYFLDEEGETISFEGSISLSANGTTTIEIPHSLSGSPTYVNVQAKNSGATDISYVSIDSNNIYVNYSVIPTGILEYWYKYSNE